jgi:vacuolar protein sorting-associated protein 29
MGSRYGELVLVLGDLHIPHRAGGIHESFKKMLVPNRMQHVLCTGNLCGREQLDFLRSLAPSVHAVRGDMDEVAQLPEDTVVRIGDFRVGLCHGHQIVPWGDEESLAIYARQLDVDILVTGHTHKMGATEVEGRWLINPGSITGAYSGFQTYVCLSAFVVRD